MSKENVSVKKQLEEKKIDNEAKEKKLHELEKEIKKLEQRVNEKANEKEYLEVNTGEDKVKSDQELVEMEDFDKDEESRVPPLSTFLAENYSLLDKFTDNNYLSSASTENSETKKRSESKDESSDEELDEHVCNNGSMQANTTATFPLYEEEQQNVNPYNNGSMQGNATATSLLFQEPISKRAAICQSIQ